MDFALRANLRLFKFVPNEFVRVLPAKNAGSPGMTRKKALVKSANKIHIRPAHAGDDEFILSLVERFVDFELPRWRKRSDCASGIRRDLKRALDELPASENLFVAEGESGERLGFLRVQKTRDFFSGRANCHISDLVVARGCEGRGVGRALLAHAQAWAKQQRCTLITLAVFPGNTRARELYGRAGFAEDLLRLAKQVK